MTLYFILVLTFNYIISRKIYVGDNNSSLSDGTYEYPFISLGLAVLNVSNSEYEESKTEIILNEKLTLYEMYQFSFNLQMKNIEISRKNNEEINLSRSMIIFNDTVFLLTSKTILIIHEIDLKFIYPESSLNFAFLIEEAELHLINCNIIMGENKNQGLFSYFFLNNEKSVFNLHNSSYFLNEENEANFRMVFAIEGTIIISNLIFEFIYSNNGIPFSFFIFNGASSVIIKNSIFREISIISLIYVYNVEKDYNSFLVLENCLFQNVEISTGLLYLINLNQIITKITNLIFKNIFTKFLINIYSLKNSQLFISNIYVVASASSLISISTYEIGNFLMENINIEFSFFQYPILQIEMTRSLQRNDFLLKKIIINGNECTENGIYLGQINVFNLDNILIFNNKLTYSLFLAYKNYFLVFSNITILFNKMMKAPFYFLYLIFDRFSSLSNLNFHDNLIQDDVLYYVFSYQFTITNANFYNYILNNFFLITFESSITLQNCSFSDQLADVLFFNLQKSGINIDNSFFSKIIVGKLLFDNQLFSNMGINNCSFYDIISNSMALIQIKYSYLFLNYLNVKNTSSGLIEGDNSFLFITNSNFENNNYNDGENKLELSYFKFGLNSWSCQIHINQSNFQNINNDINGSVINAQYLKLIFIINNCTFSENNVKESGGVLYFWESGNITIINSKFIHNSAKTGGVIYYASQKKKNIYYSILNLTNNFFGYNYANNMGGAIFLTDFIPSGLINNNTFFNNSALTHGKDYSSKPFRLIFIQNYSNDRLYNLDSIKNEPNNFITIEGLPGNLLAIKLTFILIDKFYQKINMDFFELNSFSIQEIEKYTEKKTNSCYLKGKTSNFILNGTLTFDGLEVYGNFNRTYYLIMNSLLIKNISLDKKWDLNYLSNEKKSQSFLETIQYYYIFPVQLSHCKDHQIRKMDLKTETIICANCSPGTYSRSGFSFTCHACPQGSDCSESLLNINPGFWSNNYSVYSCEEFNSCLGGLKRGNDSCLENFEGPLCHSCSLGYVLNPIYPACDQCTSQTISIVGTVLYLIGIILVYLFILKMQILNLNHGSYKDLDSMLSIYIKILLNLMQTMSIYNFLDITQNTAQKSFNMIIQTICGFWYSIITLDCFFQYLDPDNNTIYYKIIINCSIPLLFIIIFALSFFYFKEINKMDKVIVVTFLSIYTFLPNIVKSLFDVLNCKSMYPDPGKSYIYTSLNKECYTNDYNTWIMYLVLPCCSFFLVLVPLISIIYINKAKAKNSCKDLLTKLGFLLQSFGVDKYYWEQIFFIKKIIMSVLSIFIIEFYQKTVLIALFLLMFMKLHLVFTPFVTINMNKLNNQSDFALLAILLLQSFNYTANNKIIEVFCVIGVIGIQTVLSVYILSWNFRIFLYEKRNLLLNRFPKLWNFLSKYLNEDEIDQEQQLYIHHLLNRKYSIGFNRSTKKNFITGNTVVSLEQTNDELYKIILMQQKEIIILKEIISDLNKKNQELLHVINETESGFENNQKFNERIINENITKSQQIISHENLKPKDKNSIDNPKPLIVYFNSENEVDSPIQKRLPKAEENENLFSKSPIITITENFKEILWEFYLEYIDEISKFFKIKFKKTKITKEKTLDKRDVLTTDIDDFFFYQIDIHVVNNSQSDYDQVDISIFEEKGVISHLFSSLKYYSRICSKDYFNFTILVKKNEFDVDIIERNMNLIIRYIENGENKEFTLKITFDENWFDPLKT